MFTSFSAISAVLQASASDDGLTFAEVVADLPTDPASIFTITFLFVSVALVMWAGRPKGGGGHAA